MKSITKEAFDKLQDIEVARYGKNGDSHKAKFIKRGRVWVTVGTWSDEFGVIEVKYKALDCYINGKQLPFISVYQSGLLNPRKPFPKDSYKEVGLATMVKDFEKRTNS